ncbi:hypothetical protein ACLB2K_001922 [Fragaria x ananassa]
MADSENEEYYSPARSFSATSFKASEHLNKPNDHSRSNKYCKAILKHLNKANVAMKKAKKLARCLELPQIKWFKSNLLNLEGCVPRKKPATIGDDEETSSSKDKYCEAILQHLNKANLAIKKLIYMARCHELPQIKRSKKSLQHMQHLETTMTMKLKID